MVKTYYIGQMLYAIQYLNTKIKINAGKHYFVNHNSIKRMITIKTQLHIICIDGIKFILPSRFCHLPCCKGLLYYR